MEKKLIKVRKFKVGYELRTEEYSGVDVGLLNGKTMMMTSAYTPDGLYIGNSRDARNLIVKRGIKPEYRTETSRVCSIGFCERDGKWYGWSHRGICGFKIGDMLFTEFLEGATENTPFVKHGTKTIETLDEARQAACNFAEYVA